MVCGSIDQILTHDWERYLFVQLTLFVGLRRSVGRISVISLGRETERYASESLKISPTPTSLCGCNFIRNSELRLWDLVLVPLSLTQFLPFSLEKTRTHDTEVFGSDPGMKLVRLTRQVLLNTLKRTDD